MLLKKELPKLLCATVVGFVSKYIYIYTQFFLISVEVRVV